MTQETKNRFEGHTPGPWVTRTNELSPDYLWIDTKEWMALARVVVRVADKPDPEGEANARLIAAAPDLLAENERLREVLGNLLENMFPGNDAQRQERLHGCIIHATTALKARQAQP